MNHKPLVSRSAGYTRNLPFTIIITMNSKSEAFVELVDNLGLKTNIKGLADLCNGITLFQLLYNMIDPEDQQMFDQDLRKVYLQDEEETYEAQKLRNLELLVKSITRYSALKGIDLSLKPNLGKIASDNNLEQLGLLIKSVFQVLINQKELIQSVTTLSPEAQHQLMGIFQEVVSLSRPEQEEDMLFCKISQLESQIEEKDQNKKEAMEKISELQLENQDLTSQLQTARKDIQELRKKNESYYQLETLFNKKDSEISQLNQKIQQLKLSGLRQKQQHENTVKELDTAREDLRKAVQKYESESEVQRLKKLLDDKAKTLEQSNSIMQQERTLLKKVRERCTGLEDKNKDLEEQRLELSLRIEEKEMEKETLTMRLCSLEERMKDDEDRMETVVGSARERRESLGLEILNYRFNDIGDTSLDECPNQECRKLKEEINIYKNKCLQLIKNNEILRGNNTDRSVLLSDDKLRSSEEFSNRLSSLTAENLKLKQKMANMSINSTTQIEEALNKYKRKFTNLKKKMTQDQEVRNKEAELMISTMYELRKIVQQNISGPKLVQVLRKLK